MINVRVMPCLLLKNNGLVKGIGFKDYRYVGDPVNAIRIFNMKEVDELVLLDIDASAAGRSISPQVVRNVASECFMPLTVGGGITGIEEAKKLLNAGAEKIVINSAHYNRPGLISEISNAYGAQSVVVGIDVRKNILGSYQIYSHCGAKKIKTNLVEWVKHVEDLGAGEILLTSIDRDGKMEGYDTQLLKIVAEAVNLPVIASGGAGSISDFREAVTDGQASACAAGSYFVFHGKRRAVLISFPERKVLDDLFEGIDSSLNSSDLT